jgi:hypothetical protein
VNRAGASGALEAALNAAVDATVSRSRPYRLAIHASRVRLRHLDRSNGGLAGSASADNMAVKRSHMDGEASGGDK